MLRAEPLGASRTCYRRYQHLSTILSSAFRGAARRSPLAFHANQPTTSHHLALLLEVLLHGHIRIDPGSERHRRLTERTGWRHTVVRSNIELLAVVQLRKSTSEQAGCEQVWPMASSSLMVPVDGLMSG